MIKNYLKLFLFLLFTFQSVLSQQNKNTSNINLFVGYIYSKENGSPIGNATVKTLSKEGLRYFITDENGKFEIPDTYKATIDFIEVSSLGFKKLIKEIVPDTIYLESETNQLDEVVINSKTKLKYELSFFEKLNHREVNFVWNDKAAVFIPKNNENREIKNLLYAVYDFGGVKNLKYLPFKANLYTVDSLGMPGKPILEDIPVKKEDNEYWTKVDISKYKITIPDTGIFVVFIILEEKDYPVQFIHSKIGSISAVPALKAYKYSKTYIRKSYKYSQYHTPEKRDMWLLKNWHYDMDIEY